MPRKELETELRELRKTAGSKPVSKMKCVDIATEIERLKTTREQTPASRALPSQKDNYVESSVDNIKEAKAKEFPTRPKVISKKTVEKKAVAVPATKKSKPQMSKAQMLEMLNSMSDDE